MTLCTRPSHRVVFVILCLLLSLPPSICVPYKYMTYPQIHLRLTQLVAAYPNLLRMYSAQQTFLLPHVGNCTQFQSPTDSTASTSPCTIWVLEMSNLGTLPSDPSRPEMLVSGLLHGDEVVGPHAVLAFIEYMVQNYDSNPFVKRMVDTRLATFIPITNAVGFFNGERGERQMEGNTSVTIDPNRDFGFDQQPAQCMQTVAARVINELFRTHLFRVLITFHGGTNALGYEWGDTFHCDGPVCMPAPDTLIMDALAQRMANNAGPAGSFESAYPVGDMGKLVYSVNGGMEDWAYGASWSGQGVSCTPKTLGGYPKEKTKPDTSQKRCVTYLVETARAKKPVEHELGDSDKLMLKGSPGDGHIPRNVRLLLSALDALAPYVMLHSSVVENHSKRPILSWTIGGAFVVDGTAVQWSTVDNSHTGISNVLNGTAGVRMVGGSSGSFTLALLGSFPSFSSPVFIRIGAVVDQEFAKQPNGSVPNVSPQSHLMGSRASSSWDFSVPGHLVHGRQVFFSKTRKLSISPSGGFELSDFLDVDWASRSLANTDLFDILMQRRKKSSDFGGNVIEPSIGNQGSGKLITIFSGLAGILMIVSVAIAIYVCARRKRNGRSRTDKVRSSFCITEDDEDLEERQALAPIDEELGNSDEAEEGVLSASGSRAQKVAGY